MNPETPQQIRGFPILEEQVEDLRDFAANPKQRIATGIDILDEVILGPAAGEVFTFVGRSFVGKSLLATNVMAANPDESIVFFSLEMPAHQVLTRLYSHVFNTPGADVQAAIRGNRLPSQVGELASLLPRQVIVDRPALTLDDMSAYLARYEAWYGERPALVIVDYLEEVGGAKQSGEGWVRTEATASSVKAWSKEEEVAVMMLHQSNLKTEPWEAVTPGSAKGGGFTESDAVVGIWRPGWDPGLGDDASYHQRDWFFMNVLKNRVTGDRKGELRCMIDPAMRLVKLQERLRLEAIQAQRHERQEALV